MSDQVRRRLDLLNALNAALSERAGAGTGQRAQRQPRRAAGSAPERPRPLEFDANGFPVTQRSSSFITRVARY
jgi:hypothetical protein